MMRKYNCGAWSTNSILLLWLGAQGLRVGLDGVTLVVAINSWIEVHLESLVIVDHINNHESHSSSKSSVPKQPNKTTVFYRCVKA
jgi:hypothetical protein